MDDMYIGRFLDDRYEILEKIGSGGMAVVYKARCHRLNRFVAIKILKSDLAQDPDLRRRFHAESQAVAMLSHPNIVSVYDVNHSDNVDYIVMELIEGITLKQYINRKGILNWKEALHFTTQIAKALEHAHSRGIIHRDIKPHNIMILKDGTVKVADFGIARLLSTQSTLTQQTLGSVHYISPEQAKGGAADARSDIYSVGVVMYEMLTSRLPFEGDNAVSIAIQHISSVPLQPREINPDIPVGLEEITMRAMSPTLGGRYQSATELLADLEDFRKNPSVRFNYSNIPSMADDMSATRAIPSGRVISEAERARRRVSGNGAVRSRTTAEEYRENRRRSSKTTVLVGILCVTIFIIFLGWVMWDFLLEDLFFPKTEERLPIHNFVGEQYATVRDSVEYAKYYTFKASYENNDSIPEGQIISQEPESDTSFLPSKAPVTIELTISAGQRSVLMPNYINRDYREAVHELEALNLKLDIRPIPEANDSYTRDYVFQQVPERDTILTEGMTVFLTYSVGPDVPLVKVPDLTNYSESTAMSKLEALGLVGVKKEEYNETTVKGRVFFQNYEKDTEVEKGTEIEFYISLGPEPQDDPVTPTTPSDPGTTTPEDPGTTDPGGSGTTPTEPGTPDPNEPGVPEEPGGGEEPGTPDPGEGEGPGPGDGEDPGGGDGDHELGDDDGVEPSG